LENLCDARDANCIAGLLTKYLRELRDPLFPFFLFERILDCAKTSNTDEYVSKITELIRKLPMSSYLLLRYLFAFLNFVSAYSDENMMNPYNLAVCFGPTLLRVPNSKDQVYYQNYVNEVIKNLIIHYSKIFSNNIPGPIFHRPVVAERVQHFADETACASYNSMTPSNSGIY
jgi:SLIT-ROBO Rho GTPase activating protein